jgi:hypothetical protein
VGVNAGFEVGKARLGIGVLSVTCGADVLGILFTICVEDASTAGEQPVSSIDRQKMTKTKCFMKFFFYSG